MAAEAEALSPLSPPGEPPRATPAEIRAARAFLQARGVRTIVPPDKFANAAKELDVGFQELLQMVMRLYSGGQNAMFFNHEALLKAAGGEDSGL